MASTEDYRLSATACVKMVMHAAKYPGGEVMGVIVGQANTSETQPVVLEDVVPLFHKAENVTSPLLEIALAQVSEREKKRVREMVASMKSEDNSKFFLSFASFSIDSMTEQEHFERSRRESTKRERRRRRKALDEGPILLSSYQLVSNFPILSCSLLNFWADGRTFPLFFT